MKAHRPKRSTVHEDVGPFLKWPGGKRWVAKEIARLIHTYKPRRYIEPFLGGGAVFFCLRPKDALLSDINNELIETYKAVRSDHRSVIEELRQYQVSKEFYYALRSRRPRNRIERAARLLYLNRTSFAGIYRTNKAGEFNVPYGSGHRTPEVLVTSPMLEKASSVLQAARLIRSDFEPILDKAGPGDVIYCDPTYTVAHENNGFVRYNERNFSWQDQERLRNVSHAAAHRGAVVLISNAHHNCVRRLYEPAKFRTLHRISTISRDPNKRRAIREYLIVLCPNGRG